MTKKTVLVVDDQGFNLELVACCIEDDYQVATATSGTKCLEYVAETPPDLILLDIIMPGMDGYAVCQELKSCDETAFIPVIFLSSLNQTSDRLDGYACGAEDYITKPFNVTELRYKIEVALERSQQQRSMFEQYRKNKTDQNLARDAVEQLYEMSVLVQFQRACTHCQSTSSLSNTILTTCRELGLDASVQLTSPQGVLYGGCDEQSYESKLMQSLNDAQSRLHSRNRSIFKNRQASLLIKNMPQDDELRYGRLKENLQMLINAVSDRLEIIEMETVEQIKRQSDTQRIEHLLQVAQRQMSEYQHSAKEQTQVLFDALEQKIGRINLDNQQREDLESVITTFSNELNKLDLFNTNSFDEKNWGSDQVRH